MPEIRRKGIPAALLRHLFDRVREREISEDQLGLLSTARIERARQNASHGYCNRHASRSTLGHENQARFPFGNRGRGRRQLAGVGG